MTLNLTSTSQVLGLQVSRPPACPVSEWMEPRVLCMLSKPSTDQLSYKHATSWTTPHLICAVCLVSLFASVASRPGFSPSPAPSLSLSPRSQSHILHQAANDFPLETTLVLMGPSWFHGLE